MKIGSIVFYVFESARLQSEILCIHAAFNTNIPCCRALGLPRLGCQAPLGSGDGVARKKSPSVFVANRACHPDLPQHLPHVYGILTCTTYHSQLKFSDGAWVASHWAASFG
ncbi:MAG: hypothetical protein LHW59_06815, partial [Candidatus Cloacimonetes bacterium]|nr:hypothetical protein [Candidatus Cloacimonadota bacterium]